jgi:hypothetical protein
MAEMFRPLCICRSLAIGSPPHQVSDLPAFPKFFKKSSAAKNHGD